MTFPKVAREDISNFYAWGFVLSILGLLFDGILMQGLGVAVLVWTFYSDDDESNHYDPPGTEYVDNREVRQ